MKSLFCALFAMALLAACGTPGSTGGQLQPGAYQLTSFDANSSKVAGPVKIDIPFNDQSFAISAMCSNDRAVRVVATDRNEKNPVWFDCVRKQVNGITQVSGAYRSP